MQSIKLGLVGTGFIAENLATMIFNISSGHYQIVSILTRRNLDSFNTFPYEDKITNSINELIDKSDMIIECSGDVIHATIVTDEAFKAGLPVLTMNSEFHVTTGSYFTDKGYLSECQGDQPGCIAALKEEAELMGFETLVLGNFKGYLNHLPTEKDMAHWAKQQDFTIKQTTSFTDGTKVQIEQAFVANAFNASMLKEGFTGIRTNDFEQTAMELALKADEKNILLSDYLISDMPLPTGIFIAGKHNDQQQKALKTYKLGDGPYYVLHTSYHLCAFEILKTVNRYLLGLPPLLNSKEPKISVAAIAKTELKKGTEISSAIGSFQCRGEAIFAKNHPGHIPIGILENAVVSRTVEPGAILTFDDIELKPSLALDITNKLFD